MPSSSTAITRKVPIRLPEYASCLQCREYWRDTLRTVRGSVLCANCADTWHERGECLICGQEGPIERHHVAGRDEERQPRHPEVLPLCLCCHRIDTSLRARQRSLWKGSHRTGVFRLQGYLNLLWLESWRRPPPDDLWRCPVTLLLLVLMCFLAAKSPDLLVRTVAQVCEVAWVSASEALELEDADWTVPVIPEDWP